MLTTRRFRLPPRLSPRAAIAPPREQHHYRTIQSLAHTLGWKAAQVNQIDRFRKKRNIGGYETAGLVSDREALEMLQLAAGLRDEVVAWLRASHPELLGG